MALIVQVSCGERMLFPCHLSFHFSHIWTRSTRNNRIERLWVEVGAQFAHRWRAFFQRLEQLHGLDVQDESHLWLLHALFLDEINEDCEQFCSDWNSHPVSGVGHDESPEVICSFISFVTEKNSSIFH